eukprot:scaffold3176_cov56-Phaeocystis_antarctica.AAC.4
MRPHRPPPQEAGSSSAHASEDDGVLTHSIDDDDLFRALAGDVEAAKAVQERQQQRRLQRTAPPSSRSQPVPVPVPVPATAAALTPRESSGSGVPSLKLDCSSLLEQALSGACTWLYTRRGVRELVMPLKRESTMTLVRKLDERRTTAEELKTELARRDDLIHQGRRTLDAMREEYEALQSRRAEARTEEGQQKQQVKKSV